MRDSSILFLLISLLFHSTAFRILKSSYKQPWKHQAAIIRENGLGSLIVPSVGKTKFVFVGGKGGVGKTSTSSSIGLSLADRSFRTLIVSTDPAHSLGDALDVDLSNGKVVRIMSETNLWALEIDVEEALEEFKANANGLDSESIAASLGIPKEIVDSLGLDDLASIFTNPPPGIDEIVALTKVFQYAKEKTESGFPRFDRIVIDTAPTGHTIRLLQLPEFLNSVTGKLIKLQAKITSAVNTFKGLFGGDGTGGAKPINYLEKIEALQETLRLMKISLKDPATTQFVVVTIPTSLAVEESKRLLTSLQSEGIAVSSIVCNQVISETSTSKYVETRRGVQRRCIEALEQKAQGLSESAVEITEVPYIDTEVMSVHGLRYFASLAHAPKATGATNPINSRKLTIFGGKGGVGKTTSAASWGVRLADSGLRTLVVSTDPAHSLGDALQERLSGVPRLLDSTAGGGELWAMEVDPQSALQEFRDTLESTVSPGSSAERGQQQGPVGAMGLPNLKGELTFMLSGINDPPPGTDEVVAMTKVVSYLEKGYTTPNGVVHKFDRVVLDTAPTGHTLRMLQLPLFLQQLMKKVRGIKDKTGGMMGMIGMMTGGDDGSSSSTNEGSGSGEKGPDKLLEFEGRMERLEAMLHDPEQAEFTIVTIPTELATAETCRLITSLQAEDIAVRRMIINQVLPAVGAAAAAEGDSAEEAEAAATTANEAYLRRLRQGQESSLATLQVMSQSAGVPLITVPYFEMEVRTVYGLRAIGNFVFPPQ